MFLFTFNKIKITLADFFVNASGIKFHGNQPCNSRVDFRETWAEGRKERRGEAKTRFSHQKTANVLSTR